MNHRSLEKLHVIGIRYRRTTPAAADERGLDAYAASNVYASAGVPFTVEEPDIASRECLGDAVSALGSFNGRIADTVAVARRLGNVILMTGGDCSHATGIVGGLQEAHGPGLRLGLVWFDAHGDFNTPSTSQSGSLGGMPLAVCAGLAHPEWREGAHISAPLPTNRIVLVDARNLDEAEGELVRATDITHAAIGPGFPGEKLESAIERLSEQCEAIYLHMDADILDAVFVPSHGTKEPDGPDIAQTLAAVDVVMATGKVVALSLVSIYNQGSAGRVSVQSGIKLLRGGLNAWKHHGTAILPLIP
ncbi:arginase family protein [Candidatus Bipolaricaulota bacterium]|nr:arginase family protein [Candidatus Bipolaricaulota bacterium]